MNDEQDVRLKKEFLLFSVKIRSNDNQDLRRLIENIDLHIEAHREKKLKTTMKLKCKNFIIFKYHP